MMRVRAALIAGLATLAAAAPAQADVWTVTNGSSDATTPACNVDLHTCASLRTALAASEATKDVPDTINVPAGTININNDLVIQSDITVVGASARTSIIDGGFKYRGLRVTPSGNAKFSHFTIRNAAAGQGGSPDGGGILNDNGVAQLSFVRVTTSQAAAGGSGGGIANYRGTMTLSKVLVDNNTAPNGAGLASIGGPETPDRALLGLVDSTVFKNTAGTGGTGAIDSRGGTTNLLILNRTTVADNVGGVRGLGGLQILSGTAQVLTSVVARNTVGGVSASCGDVKPTSSTNNVEDERDCAFDLGGVNPGLATSLSNAGGELDALALTGASPAVDRGVAGACGTGATDQRGRARPQGPACDAGAYELDQAPAVTITGGPSGPVADTTPTFTFTGSGGAAGFQCRVDTAAFAACSSPFTTAALPQGLHTFEVRALSAAGAPDTTPASRSFTVDTVAPDTTIASGPATPGNDSTPTFAFDATETGSTLECRVDGGAFAACGSPFTTGALGEGTHSFDVRAIDRAGTPDPSAATQSFTIDLTPPPPAVVSGPDGTTTGGSPSFEFIAAGAETVSCRLDGPDAAIGTFGACTSPRGFSGLLPGAYVFVVRSVDAAGNGTETRRLFTVTGVQRVQPPPTPTFHQSVVVAPARGTILVRLKDAKTFEPLDVTKGIPLGSEVDARKGRVRLTSVPKAGGSPETADFFDGLFTVHQIGDITELRLSEKLTGCKPAKKKASAAAAAAAGKPKTRKLWGDGKGKFRTRGQYSAATVRGTRWLVQDSCTSTLTRVTVGVVAVNDFAKKKTVLVKKGKRYTARPKKK